VVSPIAAPVAAPEADPTSPPVALSDDAIPGRPYLLGSTSKSLTIGWREPSTTTEQITGYIVFANGKNMGTTTEPPFDVTGLTPATSYTFTVRSLDADGNKSKPSSQFVAGTAILVDDFTDGDDTAVDDWGAWRLSFGGVQEDGNAEMHFDVDGFNNTGVQLMYNVDSGTSGYANLFLDYSDGEPIDLTASSIVGVQFRIKGQEKTSIRVAVATPLAPQFNPIVYRSKELSLTEDDFEMVTLMFMQDFSVPEETPADYTITDAMQQTTALVFENDTPGTWGWFIIDEIEFLTPQSLALGAPPDEEVGTGNGTGTGENGWIDDNESEINGDGAAALLGATGVVWATVLALATIALLRVS
jgi:Fibronectin type III domain